MYRLREIERKDLVEINQWRNDPELIECLGAPFRYINLNVDEKWFDNYMNSRSSTVRCAIVSEEDRILGLVSLVSIDNIHRSAELHIMIGARENQGKGLGSFAVKEMLVHAFNNLNLHRVCLSVLETNLRAQHFYEKMGFTREGIKRSSNYKNGKYSDMFMYSILENEFVIGE